MQLSGLARIYSHAAAAWLVLAAGAVLSVSAALLVERQVEREARLQFESAVNDAKSAIGTRVSDYTDVLYGARGLFATSDHIGRDQFRSYVRNLELDKRFPGIEVIHFGRRISAEERPGFEARVRADRSVDPAGYPGFRIRPAGERSEYVVAQYVEPMAGNERVHGLDIRGDAARLAAIERARDSGLVTATGSIALVRDPTGSPGFGMRLAVYRRDAAAGTVVERRESFIGVVSASFVMNSLMRGVLREKFVQNVHVRIHDAGFLGSPAGPAQPAAGNLLFDSDRLQAVATRTQGESGGGKQGMNSASEMEVGGRRWILQFSARDGIGEAFERWLPWSVLLGGVTASLLLFGLVRSLAGSSSRAVELAGRITENLRKSEETLRATNEQLQLLIQSSPLAIYARDRNGLITAWNPAAERMYGWSAAEVLGKPLPSVPGEQREESDQLRKRLLGGESFIKFQGRRLRRDGSPIFIDASLGPLRDASGTASGIIAVAADITERKRAELQQAMEHRVTRLLSEAESLEQVMPEIIRTVCEALGCACGARRTWDEREQKIACAETWCEPSPDIRQFLDLSREPRSLPRSSGGLLRRVLASGEPTWITDVTGDPSFRRGPEALKAGLRGAFAFPIRFGNETLGIMEFFGRGSRAPDPVLIQSTRSIGSQIGQFMGRKQAEERVLRLAHYDALTGLPNRSMFHQRVGQAIARARRSERQLAILFIDLDRFKNINDTLGHDAGDRALNEIATRLRGCLRETDTVGRLGGDEFVVLIEELPDPAQVALVAQKVLAEVERPVALDEQEVHITTSIGIATYPADSEDLQGLMKNADIAMYRAKEHGKNNYQFYSAQMNVHTLERLAMESDLRRALERNEFVLHYQPKIDLATGAVGGMEALLRWRHPVRGLVAPAEFVPLAEETGLIVPIGQWVLRTACEQNRAWQAQGLSSLCVAVNLSARQFSQETLLQDVARVLSDTGLDASLLELEITESMVMRNPAHAVALLDSLKAMGVRLSIDDFGTGYSSLSYLKRFPIDNIKIDRSFIQDLPADGEDAAITRAIIAMAHSLRLTVVAEGVETDKQRHFLHQHGCDEMQGFLFSRPLTAEDFLRLLQGSAIPRGLPVE
ncbi:MAG: EAL domain-containing protein [Candidatus Parcubacteria bacterium]|nr:EAL domain-containing protein [Burkholderiales bacterium]